MNIFDLLFEYSVKKYSDIKFFPKKTKIRFTYGTMKLSSLMTLTTKYRRNAKEEHSLEHLVDGLRNAGVPVNSLPSLPHVNIRLWKILDQ
jgi:hypothetical protein